MPYFQDPFGGIHFLDDIAFQDRLPLGCVQISDAVAAGAQAPSLDDLKAVKRAEIRGLSATEANANVPALGLVWQGGFDSAIKLDAAKRMAEAAGAPQVRFFDAFDDPQTLSIADATLVILAVAGAYDSALERKKNADRAITAATTAAQLDAITWS